jgi:hypothetical protein
VIRVYDEAGNVIETDLDRWNRWVDATSYEKTCISNPIDGTGRESPYLQLTVNSPDQQNRYLRIGGRCSRTQADIDPLRRLFFSDVSIRDYILHSYWSCHIMFLVFGLLDAIKSLHGSEIITLANTGQTETA